MKNHEDEADDFPGTLSAHCWRRFRCPRWRRRATCCCPAARRRTRFPSTSSRRIPLAMRCICSAWTAGCTPSRRGAPEPRAYALAGDLEAPQYGCLLARGEQLMLLNLSTDGTQSQAALYALELEDGDCAGRDGRNGRSRRRICRRTRPLARRYRAAGRQPGGRRARAAQAQPGRRLDRAFAVRHRHDLCRRAVHGRTRAALRGAGRGLPVPRLRSRRRRGRGARRGGQMVRRAGLRSGDGARRTARATAKSTRSISRPARWAMRSRAAPASTSPEAAAWILPSGHFAFAYMDTCALVGLDPAGFAQARRLTIVDESSVPCLDSAYYAFANERGDVTVTLSHADAGDLVGKMLSQDASADIYVLATSREAFAAARDRRLHGRPEPEPRARRAGGAAAPRPARGAVLERRVRGAAGGGLSSGRCA